MSNFDDYMRERRKGKPLVDLLRDSDIGCSHSCLCDAAADEIERLRAALQELLDDPLSDIRADMRIGMMKLLNQQFSGNDK